MAATPSLSSPVGQYKPELLFLAPEGGNDLHTLSFIAQLLELGVAVELDENWRLPTAPPRELSAYKACCFPETAKEKHGRDLVAFYRNGGFVPYFAYYEVEPRDAGSIPFFYRAYGRDVYFWTMAHVVMEGDLTRGHADFARTMEARPVRSMIAEFRADVFARYDKPLERWSNWGDPGYTMLVSSFCLAETLGDADWLRVATHCMQTLNDSRHLVLRKEISENKLPDTADAYVPMMAGLLMERGVKDGKPQWIASGVEMAENFLGHCREWDGAIIERWMNTMWSESMLLVPTLCWLARVTGDRKHAVAALNTARAVAKHTHHANGLWHHWGDRHGKKGAFWSRGVQWPVLWMTQALPALDPGSELAEFMRGEIAKTYDALARFQHREKGLWHLVIDEPVTRLESSASGAFIYCYDRLREMEMISPKHGDMVERAFVGLKRLFYHGGLASTCRGTGFGATPDGLVCLPAFPCGDGKTSGLVAAPFMGARDSRRREACGYRFSSTMPRIAYLGQRTFTSGCRHSMVMWPSVASVSISIVS